jgi:hypothetical protein
MSALVQLDNVISDLAMTLFREAPTERWERQRLEASYTPDGGVGGHDYWYELDDGKVDRGISPHASARSAIRALTKNHWRLTQDLGQARWYKMTVTVERSGKFSVDFEYKDDYQEGDIMRRG